MRALVVCALLMCVSATGWAGPLGMRMVTNATTVRQGDSFQLDVVLTVEGQDAVDELELPDLSDFTIVQESEAQSASIHTAQGRRRIVVEHRRSFVLKATEAGTKQIGEARARLNATTARAAPITITVIGLRGVPDPSSSAPGDDDPASQADVDQDARAPSALPEPGARFGDTPPKIFAELRTDKSRAFVGEQVSILGEVYSQVPLGQYPRVPGPKPPGFVCLPIDDGTRLQATQRVLGGRTYYVYPFSRDAIFATKPGKVTLAPIELEVSPAGSFFARSQDVRVKSNSVEVEIVALPTPAPPGFSPDNVGRVELRASVRPATATAGEPFTLVVEVVGWGNIEGFSLPRWSGSPDARLFPPSTKRERRDQEGLIAGRVVEETLVQLQRPGTVIIPALQMTVFDPAEGRFTTVASEPVRVVVGAGVATKASSTRAQRQVIGAGARPLALGIDPRGRVEWALAPRLGGLTLGVGLLIGSLGWWRRRRAESAEGQLARRTTERAAAARDAATAVDVTAAHRLLLDALADRCGDDVRACVAASLPPLLMERGLDAHLAARVAEAIVRGESARFAPGGQRSEAVSDLVACIGLVDEPTTRSS
jgi:hypothetical protein